jgi:hypothetical protein
MTDERDPKLSQRYRELGADEPPRELDESILAAAHRATAGRHRWYLALGAAAIVMLAVGITVHIERQRPDAEALPASPPLEPRARDSAPPPSAVPQSRPEQMAAPAARERIEEAQIDSPERWLERIVQLRREGKHDEAQRQLAEFRRRYPQYKVPEAALK